ncbi:mucin-2 isoform X2 [Sitodiplosis mosellana]|uniref:mucin-2 isoform X2 n=1 Tax=Sitodiplosis mosellana TaxID=263140 RepID=UPI002443A9DF|nr:mucin-2 isoform X2 [Sitodiplosis mosellana]
MVATKVSIKMRLPIKFIGCILCVIGVVSKSSAFMQNFAPETNRCNYTAYFNPVTKNCTTFLGGGRAMFVDQNKQCRDNFVGVKPYLDHDTLYVVCEPDLVVLAKCPDNLRFNTKTLKCEAIKRLPCDLAHMPECTKPGRFALEQNSSCFYTCDADGEQFVPKLHRCAGSSLYSPALKRCSYSCKMPPTQIFEEYEMDPTEKGFFPPCTKPGQFRTPTNCSRYYICSAKTNGRFYQTRHKCPDGTIYDVKTETCKPSAEVKCEMMSIVELLNLYEFYKERKQQCKHNYTDDASIESCMQACPETEITTTTLTTETDTFTSTSEKTPSTTTKPIELSTVISVISNDSLTTTSTHAPIVSTSTESAEESDEETSMELLDASTGLKPRRKKLKTTTASGQEVYLSTSTVGSKLDTGATINLETSTTVALKMSTETEQSSSTVQSSVLNDTYSSLGDSNIGFTENISNDSNILSTTEASSTQGSTTEVQLGLNTTLHEASASNDLIIITATPVPNLPSSDTTPADVFENNPEHSNNTTLTPEFASTPESSTTIKTTTTEYASSSPTDGQNAYNSTVPSNDSSEATTKTPQTNSDGQILSTIRNDNATDATTIANYNSTDAVTFSTMPSQSDLAEGSNLQKDSLIGSNLNETKPSTDNSTTEVLVDSTETVVNFTSIDRATEQETTANALDASTELTSNINSATEVDTSPTYAADSKKDTMENMDSRTLKPTESAQISTEKTSNTSEAPLSPSSLGHEENSTIENTTLLENTTRQDEINFTAFISPTPRGEDELLGQAQTEAAPIIANDYHLSEEPLDSTTTQVNEEQNSTEFTSFDKTTSNIVTETSTSLPESPTQADALTTLESASLVSSDKYISTTSSSNASLAINTTTDENVIESTTTAQIQQDSNNSNENVTLENASLRPENTSANGNGTVLTESSTLPDHTSHFPSDSTLGDSLVTPKVNENEFNPLDQKKENDSTTSESLASTTTPITEAETIVYVPSNSSEDEKQSDERTTTRNEDDAFTNPSELDPSSTEISSLTSETLPSGSKSILNDSITLETIDQQLESKLTNSSTDSSTLSNQTQNSDVEQPQSELLLSSDLTENPELRNDATTNDPIILNSTTVYDQEFTTDEPASNTPEHLKPETFQSTSQNVPNSSPFPRSDEIEPSSTSKNDLVVDTVLGSSTEIPFTSIATENIDSMVSETTNAAPNSNATTVSDPETTTFTSTTIDDLITASQNTPEASTTTQPNTNIETTNQSSDATIEESSEKEDTTTNESITLENISEVVQSNSTSNNVASPAASETASSSENDENPPTTPSLLDLLTTTWWPSTTENETKKEVKSTESTSTQLTSTIVASTETTSTESTSIVTTTEIQNSTSIPISTTPSNAVQAAIYTHS